MDDVPRIRFTEADVADIGMAQEMWAASPDGREHHHPHGLPVHRRGLHLSNMPGAAVNGGRLPDPGLGAICARCNEPREAHGGPKHYGACPDQSGLRAARFRLQEADKPPPSMVGIVAHAKRIYDDETGRIDRLQQRIDRAARRRAEALASLHDNSGMSYKEIGDLIGRSAPRVGQIIASLRIEAA